MQCSNYFVEMCLEAKDNVTLNVIWSLDSIGIFDCVLTRSPVVVVLVGMQPSVQIVSLTLHVAVAVTNVIFYCTSLIITLLVFA